MARQRFIWPSLWTDPTVGQLSPPARLLFIGCFSNADDDGRLEADPAYLKATIFPHDRFDAAAVQSFRDELIDRCRNLVLYEVDGREYMAFIKWPDFQKPKYPRPSKLPAPPKKSRKPAQLTEKPSGNAPEALPEDSPSLPPRDGMGRDGLENLNPAPEPEPEANYAADQTDDQPTFVTPAQTNGAGAGAGDWQHTEEKPSTLQRKLKEEIDRRSGAFQ